ncbi:MAG: hypothetical protein A2Z29_10540 [Chloroflexi bacterium RBG_16_56_11]|nr:MAG: hypothetical protein A2Z29_10540 [Chloroflexi bacterium RBG_16_56_11]
MRINKYMEVVGSGPKPRKEKEYNDWYHKHITDLFAFGGLKRVSRSKLYKPLVEPGPLYLTIYEFDAPEDLVAFYEHHLMADAKIHFEQEAPKSVELYWAGFYEPVETLEK